ncbi:hypothetical protein ABN034_19350 [Actinopolymorpha sp. B11F2]|uniref:hypothetical protein n=1 Tax=Actinopolymorpha sp. B11F2 TaxID=3160862 RepID=UPI0032E414DB
MSRGPGKVMRDVERAVRKEYPAGMLAVDVSYLLYGETATAAQRESVRRAVRALRRAGRIERVGRRGRPVRRSREADGERLRWIPTADDHGDW